MRRSPLHSKMPFGTGKLQQLPMNLSSVCSISAKLAWQQRHHHSGRILRARSVGCPASAVAVA